MPRLPVLAATASVALLALGGTTSAALAKTHNGHRLPASWQKRFHVHSATADPDGDGLTNWTEYRAHTAPRHADTDRDGVSDADEDGDRDGLDNLTEQRAGTDPGARDSDRDGRSDAREDSDRDGLSNLAEQRTANDPGNVDSDGDDIPDGGENAGRIVSFDGEVLTLRLAATHRTVTAPVDDATELQCGASGAYESSYDDDPGNAASGDDSADDDSGLDNLPSDDGTDDSASTGDDADSSDSADAADSGDAIAAAAAADPGGDDPTAVAAASVDDSAGDCEIDVLQPGAYVHEAELTSDVDEGTTVFDAVAVVVPDDA